MFTVQSAFKSFPAAVLVRLKFVGSFWCPAGGVVENENDMK